MRVIDNIPHVLLALNTQGPLNQGDLTVLTWGTSGKNNPKLTKGLFPYMEDRGLMKTVKIPGRRGTIFQITPKGKEALALVQMDPADVAYFLKGVAQRRADGEIG